jgi:hypothetical protein
MEIEARVKTEETRKAEEAALLEERLLSSQAAAEARRLEKERRRRSLAFRASEARTHATLKREERKREVLQVIDECDDREDARQAARKAKEQEAIDRRKSLAWRAQNTQRIRQEEMEQLAVQKEEDEWSRQLELEAYADMCAYESSLVARDRQSLAGRLQVSARRQ